MIEQNNLRDLAEAYFSVTVKERANSARAKSLQVCLPALHTAQKKKFKISHFAARLGNRCAACASPCVCSEGEGAPDVSKNNGIDP